LLKRIDPSAIPAEPSAPAPTGPAGKGVTPENLRKLQEELQRKLQERGNKPADDKGGAGTPRPPGSP
jgi:hypothetical protein